MDPSVLFSGIAPLALLNPGLLFLGAGLIAVPILIHLFNRRRVRRQPWAAMQWLLAAMKKHQRRLQVENWLILLLRIAAVFLLGLALARPVLTNPDLARLVAGKRNVYLVLDTSYSLAARTKGRAVIDVAKAEVDAVLSELGGDDTIAVIVTNDPRSLRSDGRSPFTLLPRTVGERGVAKAKEAVAAVRTRDAPADWRETLVRLQQQTAEEDQNRVVVVVTDLQARDWHEQQVKDELTEVVGLPVALRIIDVGGRERRNLTVAEVKSALRRDAFVGRPVKLDVTIENQGPKPVAGAKVSVFLDSDPTPIRTMVLPTMDAVDVAADRSGSARLLLDLPGRAFKKAGSHVLRVEVVPPHDDPGADALGLDSKRGFALRVRDRIRVLMWTRKSRDAGLDAAAYLRGVYERWEINDKGERIRERSPLYELRSVTSEAGLADALVRRSGDGVDLVVLANVAPRGRAVDALRDFVRGGGALIAFPGDAIPDPSALNDAFHADADHRLLPFAYDAPEVKTQRATDTPFLLDFEAKTGHPLAAPFTGEEALTWIALVPPQIWGRMAFLEEPGTAGGPDGGAPAETAAGGGRVVLRFAGDGRPAVVEGMYGMGRTIWLATSVDHGWFERALFFLPVLLDEAAVWATRPDDAQRNLEVGRRIVVTWLPRDAVDARFQAPGGSEVQPTREEGLGETDRPMLVLDRVGTAGTWRLLYDLEGYGGEMVRTEEHFAVNPEPGEGRLRRAVDENVLGALPPGSDVQILESWEEVEEEAGEIHQGEITSLLLWLVIALLALESVLAWLFGRRHHLEPAADAGARG